MDQLLISKTMLAAGRTSLFRRRAVPAALALLTLCGGLWVASAQAVFKDYTGTLTWTGMLNPGTFECLNGQPTGVPWYRPDLGPACSPADCRVRIRGLVFQYRQETDDPRTTGVLTIVVNANLDQWPGSGPFWGTGRLEVDDGGVWEGNWTGERALTTELTRAVMHGSGGAIQGLKSEALMTLTSKAPAVYSVTGTILQPGGK